MLKRNADPSPDDDPYPVLTQDEEEDEEGNFFNEDELLHDVTEAICTWGLPKNGDWFAKLKTLFKEEGEKEVEKR
nr:hypothetical protein CFP56_53860 [Quercus suber]